MTYELAKQLKDAGFPQEVTDPFSYFDHTQRRFGWSEGEDEPTNYTKLPTLSELIEACGDAFTELSLVGPSSWWARAKWKARATAGHWPLAEANGKTPEEAVAKLWLALNKTQ